MNYEVLKFVEHGKLCRVVLDYIPGELLFQRLQREPTVGKKELYDWLLGLVTQLEQWYKQGVKRYYRYLNPYSILLCPEGKTYLLDLESKNNAFVLRNLQKRVMRTHFLKADQERDYGNHEILDLYSLGKTIQFLMAHSDISPELSKGEESRLLSFVEKCLSENPQKQWDNFMQAKKEMFKIHSTAHLKRTRSRGSKLAIAAIFAILALTGGFVLHGQLFGGEGEMEVVEAAEQVNLIEGIRMGEVDEMEDGLFEDGCINCIDGHQHE